MPGSSRRARKGQASCPNPWLTDRSFGMSACASCASKTIRPPYDVNGGNTHAGTIVGGDRTGCNTAHCLIQAYASVLDGSVPRQKARFFATIFVCRVPEAKGGDGSEASVAAQRGIESAPFHPHANIQTRCALRPPLSP